MLDAALPYVCGRKLRVWGLDEAEEQGLRRWANDASAQSVTVSRDGVVTEGELILLLFPDTHEPPALTTLDVIETQYVFEVPDNLAADTAQPTLPADEDWPYARQARGLWLDVEKPKQPMGCFVIARERAKGAEAARA
jgi:hypothetical protein